MIYTFQYPNFTTLRYAEFMCDRDGDITRLPTYQWLVFGKLPESQTLYPAYAEVYSTANGANKYISDVTVEPIPPTNTTASIAVGATLTINNPAIHSATSTDASIASVSVLNNVATITGVAAGTATITILDKAEDLMQTVVVTVA